MSPAEHHPDTQHRDLPADNNGRWFAFEEIDSSEFAGALHDAMMTGGATPAEAEHASEQAWHQAEDWNMRGRADAAGIALPEQDQADTDRQKTARQTERARQAS